MALSNPTSRREVILRDILPGNVILLSDWMRGLNERGMDTIAWPGKKSPWQNQIISNLYKRFFLHFHPGRFTLHEYDLFLALTLPSLTRMLSFQSIKCLCSAIHWRNRKLLLAAKISREKHRRRFIAVVANTFIPPPPVHPEIKKPLHKEAWRILWALALHKGDKYPEGHFFIAGRELRDRLFIRSYKTAQRILAKFCEIGVIEKVGSGDRRWEALAQGRRPLANSYRLSL